MSWRWLSSVSSYFPAKELAKGAGVPAAHRPCPHPLSSQSAHNEVSVIKGNMPSLGNQPGDYQAQAASTSYDLATYLNSETPACEVTQGDAGRGLVPVGGNASKVQVTCSAKADGTVS